MRLSPIGREQTGRYKIQAVVEPQDAVPPVDCLTFDLDPLTIHDDVVSVASVLAFGDYVSGNLSLPKKVAPEVARAIENFLEPVWVSVSPIEFEPRANSVVSSRLIVSAKLSDWHSTESVWGAPRNESLTILPAAEFSGFLASTDGLIVASNAAILSHMGRDSLRVFPYLAVAAIYSESFHANTLVLDEELSAQIDDSEFERARSLLHSCRLSLLRYSPDYLNASAHL